MTIREILRRLWATIGARSAERDMQRELREHLEAAAARFQAAGMTPADAMTAARHEFGNIGHIAEQMRDARGFTGLADLGRDVRHGLRTLARAPAFTVVVTATVALGVGALTTAFAIAYGALWRQPPVPAAATLRLPLVTITSARYGIERMGWSYPNTRALRSAVEPVMHTASFTAASATVSRAGDPEFAPGEVVAPEYFDVLGVQPVLGRVFRQDEDGPGIATPAVVLAHDEWRTRFAGDSAAVGAMYRVNGNELSVIGVMPAGFRGLTNRARFWITTGMATRLTYVGYQTTNQTFISVVGRMRAGVSHEQAADAVHRFGAAAGDALFEDPPDGSARTGTALLTLNDARAGRVALKAAPALLAAVTALYLLACANVANLMLGHTVSRRRERAVRAALGGGVRRVAWQSLVGSLAAVLAGGVLGVTGAAFVLRMQVIPAGIWGGGLIRSLAPFADPGADVTVVAFGTAVIALTALLVLWAPAVTVARDSLANGLRGGARGASGAAATRRRPTLRGALVVIEATLAMMLLVGGGLLATSFARIRATEVGVSRTNVLTFWIRPSEARYPPNRAPAFVARVVREIERVPGVEAVSVDGGAPVAGSARGTMFIVGRPIPAPNDIPMVRRHYVAPNHFRVLGISLLRGRGFTALDDAGAPRVAVVSASAAERFWPGADPIGQRIWFGPGSGYDTPDSAATIVGIVSDAQYDPLDQRASATDIYTPFTQFTYVSRAVLVRTTGHPLALVPAVRSAVQAVDPDVALVEPRTLEDVIGNSWARQRFDAQVFATFAVLALLLAATGLYAVVAHGVAQRTREMGIRAALGARRGAIFGLIFRDGMTFPAIGVAAGTVGALACGRALQTLLYEVGPADPLVLAGAAVLLLAAAAVACVVPARRATRADPMAALRAE